MFADVKNDDIHVDIGSCCSPGVSKQPTHPGHEVRHFILYFTCVLLLISKSPINWKWCKKSIRFKRFLLRFYSNVFFDWYSSMMCCGLGFVTTNINGQYRASAGGPYESPRTLVAKEYFCLLGLI